MFVVTVTFVIKSENLDDFMAAMTRQAHNSLTREQGCLQFDVCRDQQNPERVFLYVWNLEAEVNNGGSSSTRYTRTAPPLMRTSRPPTFLISTRQWRRGPKRRSRSNGSGWRVERWGEGRRGLSAQLT